MMAEKVLQAARITGIGLMGSLMSRPFHADATIKISDCNGLGDPTRLLRDFHPNLLTGEEEGEEEEEGKTGEGSNKNAIEQIDRQRLRARFKRIGGIGTEDCDGLAGRPCKTNADCANCDSDRPYICLFNSNGTRGVCGSTAGRDAYNECSTLFATEQPYVMHGAVLWKCTSKYPELVDDRGRPLCCIGGRFVNKADGILYVPGFHDPRECECRDCPRGTLSDGVNCLRDPCYPGYGVVTRDGDRRCECPPGYVDCPGEAFRGDDRNVRKWYCPRAVDQNMVVCVRDPCRPYGKFDRTLKKCVPSFESTWKETEGIRNNKTWQSLFRLTAQNKLVPERGFMGTGRLCDRSRLVPSRDPPIDYDQWWSKWLPNCSPVGIDKLTSFAQAVRKETPEDSYFAY